MTQNHDSDKPALIQEYALDAQKGTLQLTIPMVDDMMATAVKLEVEGLQKSTNYPAHYDYAHNGDTINVTISSPDTACLAMNAAKFMTRRVREGSDLESLLGSKAQKYAEPAAITDVLTQLRDHAQQTTPNVARAIDNLIATTKSIELM